MFHWKQKNSELDELVKLQSPISEAGVNKRAINLVPLPVSEGQRQIRKSHHMRYQQLLLSIEAKQSSCCLRIVNPDKKSRAAVLIFRGRVLGCIYGRKGLHEQLFGREGFGQTFVELTRHDNIVDTYLLSEELVLAGAALFHGAPLSIPCSTAAESFEWSSLSLTRGSLPGCIVVNNKESLAIGMMYVFRGRIVGVYSFKSGWVEPTYEAGLRLVTQTPDCTVAASCLTAANVNEVMNLTFSLTGLEERETRTTLFTRTPQQHAAIG